MKSTTDTAVIKEHDSLMFTTFGNRKRLLCILSLLQVCIIVNYLRK